MNFSTPEDARSFLQELDLTPQEVAQHANALLRHAREDVEERGLDVIREVHFGTADTVNRADERRDKALEREAILQAISFLAVNQSAQDFANNFNLKDLYADS